MGFGEAFINMQLVYQRIFDSPWIYNAQERKLTVNPKLKTPWKMPTWHLIKIVIYIANLYFILRFRRISKTYKTGTLNPEDIVFVITALAITTQTWVTMYAMEQKPKGFVYSVTQTLQAGDVTHLGWPNSRRHPDIPELIGYGIAIVFCNFPLMAALYPLLRDQDPLNVELKDILPSVPRRLLAVVLYVPLVFVGGTICSQFLLMVLTVVQNLALETDKNYKLSMGKSMHKTPNWVERLVRNILKFGFTNLETRHPKISRVQPLTPELPGLEESVSINIPVEAEIEPPEPCGNDMSLNKCFQIRRKRHITIYMMINMSNSIAEADIYLGCYPLFDTFSVSICVLTIDQHY
ncbi:unnamed protein product [Orchesella dallaii]|uniref:Uncharacterized protein n=1 Tax=Orchesella dallaii TaxID=48710 RepID=A0ABP1QVC8_9HEXA